MIDEVRKTCPKAFAEMDRHLSERRAAGLTCVLYRGNHQVMVDPETDDLFVRFSFVFQDGTGFYIDVTEGFPLLDYARELKAQGLCETIYTH